MPIRVTLDQLIVRKGLKARDLAAEVGLSETQLSLFRSGKVKGIRFRTLAKLCAALDCKPKDLLDYDFDPAEQEQGAADHAEGHAGDVEIGEAAAAVLDQPHDVGDAEDAEQSAEAEGEADPAQGRGQRRLDQPPPGQLPHGRTDRPDGEQVEDRGQGPDDLGQPADGGVRIIAPGHQDPRRNQIHQGQQDADADDHEDGQPAELGAAAAETVGFDLTHGGGIRGWRLCLIFNLDLKAERLQLYV